MPKFTFTGDPKVPPGKNPPTGNIYGIDYKLGEAFDVDDKATFKFADGKETPVADLLRRHSHFTEGAVKNAVKAETAQPLRAVHRGRGNFSVVKGDKELVEGLNKADADAFNALSDEDKAAYVAKKPE